MKPVAGLVLTACAAFAHVMSMSSGDLTIRGTQAHFEFRLPLYEMPHAANPEQSLFSHIVFSSAGRAARFLNGACRIDAPGASYVCTADYEFAAAVDTLDVECTFYAVTVPNHVHLLRVQNGERRDQALFDISFPRATLRFRPPTAIETAGVEAGGGFMRALGGPMQILFLIGLVLAGRSRHELIVLTGMFLAGQTAAALIVPYTNWQPAARFVEAAAALTIAYLAVEILALPKAGMRWMIVAVLGGFHGLYFALFLRTTSYHAGYVLVGAAVAEIAVIALCGVALVFATGRVRSLSAGLLLAVGLVWFFLRLRS